MSATPKPAGRRRIVNFKTDVGQYIDHVRAVGRRLCRRSQDVDDLAQEVYMRLLATSTQQIDNPLAFIYTTAAHAVIDLWHADFKQQSIAAQTDSFVPAEPLSNRPVEWTDTHQFLNKLEEALRELPSRQQEIWLLKKLYGFELAEVAAHCALSEHTVKKYLNETSRYLKAVVSRSFQ